MHRRIRDSESVERELDCEQNKAVTLLLDWRWPIAMLTGGPGTGKTTVLTAALDELDAQKLRYVLAAPTGKAARRMKQATGRDAITLHKLLRLKPRSNYVAPWNDKPRRIICSQFVFVDEASMIDVVLLAELYASLGKHNTVRLIGDPDQLPPVGPGEPFVDYVAETYYPLARLKRVHRSGPGSWVAQNAPRVLEGRMPDLSVCSIETGFRFIEAPTLDDVPKKLRELAHADDEWGRIVMESGGGVAAPILTPQKTTVAGVHALNELLSDVHLGELDVASEPYVELEDGAPLRENARVMQLRNDYERGIVNGDVGRIVTMPGELDANIYVEIDGRDEIVRYTKRQASELQVAYAFTIHKTQGSEYPWVIVVCHSAHRMVTRKLLYTALTRAKRGVILIGDVAGVRAAVQNTNEQVRQSGLRERLQEAKAARDPAHRYYPTDPVKVSP